jgi:hypothetical protein
MPVLLVVPGSQTWSHSIIAQRSPLRLAEGPRGARVGARGPGRTRRSPAWAARGGGCRASGRQWPPLVAASKYQARHPGRNSSGRERCCAWEAGTFPGGHDPWSRARNPGSPSPSPSPICPGMGMGVPSPICRGSGAHPHPHPRFAGDGGSIPIPIPDLPESGTQCAQQLSTIEYCKGVEFRLPHA